MDEIFRLHGRSFGFFGYGDLVKVASDRLCANAEADGYEVVRNDISLDGGAWHSDDDAAYSATVRKICALATERLASFDGSLYSGPRMFFFLGALNPRLNQNDYDELVRVARLSRYSGICIGLCLASGDTQDWLGIPLYSGRITSGMMVWERVNPGELP